MKSKILTILAILGLSVAAFALGSTFPYYHQRWLGTGTTRSTEQFSIQTPSEGASAIFVPGTTNTNALGSTSLRFSNLYTTLVNSAGPITATAGVPVINSTAPRTAVGVASLYTSYTVSTGTLFWNPTFNTLCISTGLVQTSIAASTAPTTACGS